MAWRWLGVAAAACVLSLAGAEGPGDLKSFVNSVGNNARKAQETRREKRRKKRQTMKENFMAAREKSLARQKEMSEKSRQARERALAQGLAKPRLPFAKAAPEADAEAMAPRSKGPKGPEEIAQEKQVVRLCEDEKARSAQSWQRPYSELKLLFSKEKEKQQGYTDKRALPALRRIPPVHPAGWLRLGQAPPEMVGILRQHLQRNRARIFPETFSPVLGLARITKLLPLLPEWTKEGGLIDAAVRPVLEMAVKKPMVFAGVHGIRIYQAKSFVMDHVDSVSKAVTVAVAIQAAGEGVNWRLMLADVNAPPGKRTARLLGVGQMAMYEGARLPHSREQLGSGELAMVFAQYHPKEQFDAEEIQTQVDQLTNSITGVRSSRGPSSGPRTVANSRGRRRKRKPERHAPQEGSSFAAAYEL